MNLVLKNCGSHEDNFIQLDRTRYHVYNVQTTEITDVILTYDSNLLSSICSMICARADNIPTCVGFSSDITANHSCTLYSEIDVDSTINTGPAMNFDGKIIYTR